MAEHNKLGQAAEELAVKWLIENGYEVLHRNWRYKQYEIDIIAGKNNFLHIFEIKARNFSPVGYPEDNVGRKKFKNLQRAADEYLFQHPGYPWIQYNILAITLLDDGGAEFFLLQDIYL